MSGYDFNRPMISIESMDNYISRNKETANQFGKVVKATYLTNIEYKTRYNRLSDEHRMKDPPSCGRFFPGVLVVRNLGSKQQYETWMPETVFEELYEKKIEQQKKNNKIDSLPSVPKSKKSDKIMTYDEIVIKCESLSYRDKFRLAQLLLQNGRKEEEKQNPKKRSNIKSGNPQAVKQEPTNDTNSIQYVMDRLSKLRPAKKKTLLNSIRSMYQFQGAISDKDQETIVRRLEESKFLKVEDNNRVTYL